MRLPIDVDIMLTVQAKDSGLEDHEVHDDLDNVLQALLEKRNSLFGKIEENIANAQQKQKVLYTIIEYFIRIIILIITII